MDTRDYSPEWVSLAYGVPLRILAGQHSGGSMITTAAVPNDDRWANEVVLRSQTMFRRLRLMTAEFDNMDEGLIWTADPETPVFTAWVFPATSLESVHTT